MSVFEFFFNRLQRTFIRVSFGQKIGCHLLDRFRVKHSVLHSRMKSFPGFLNTTQDVSSQTFSELASVFDVGKAVELCQQHWLVVI